MELKRLNFYCPGCNGLNIMPVRKRWRLYTECKDCNLILFPMNDEQLKKKKFDKNENT